MEIVQAVVEFGSQAIRNYRGKRAFVNETTIRESCLGRFIASQMMREHSWNALTEVHYTDMLVDLADLNVFDADIMSKFGGQRADIALYQNDRPAPVIELKIVDEGRKPVGVAADRDKIQLLQSFVTSTGHGPLGGYVGVFVCDTYRGGVSKLAGGRSMTCNSHWHLNWPSSRRE